MLTFRDRQSQAFKQQRTRRQSTFALLLAHFLLFQSLTSGHEVLPQKLTIADDVVLHYVERGEGDPIVFVHGLMDEYSVWLPQLEAFSKQGYRAIAYSRRLNYPNSNRIRPNHSASLEADDLAALVRKLNLQKVHIVGHSYGAYTALLFALQHPDQTRTITLAEAPIVPWLTELPDDRKESGEAHLSKLMNQGIQPAKTAILSGDEDAAIRAMLDAVAGSGKFNSLPPFVKAKCRRNALELKAFLLSDNRYPNIDRKQLGRLTVPTLILSGSESLATAKFTDPELEGMIPEQSRNRVVLHGATHMMWIEQPVHVRDTVLEFFRGK